ncbi:MAG: glucosamine inositolphosphorylceramide transferase family protein [Solirubrobacteraceae bacterium]
MTIRELHAFGVRGLRQFEARHFHERWLIAIRPRSRHDVLTGDMTGFRLLIAARRHFFADPFLIDWEGRHFLFYEDYDFGSGRGVIAYREIDPDGSARDPAVALEGEHHFSYPFVLAHGTSLYALPETADIRRLMLYRADALPGPFVLDSVLLEDAAAVDPTIHAANGCFWLFANDFPAGGSPHDSLNIFWAEQPGGPWTPHPQNPVVRNAAGARPAGALFERAGDLVRPAQDCSMRYGGSVVLKRVLRLDRDGFEEEEIGRISPGWLRCNLGTHTYNRDSRFEVVDGRWFTSEHWWLDLVTRIGSCVLEGPGRSEIRDLRSWLSHGKASRTILAALRKGLPTPSLRGRLGRIPARWRR